MEPIQNPHDKLFHEIYSHKEEARSFLENFLPIEVLQKLDTSTLEICKDSFIDEDFRGYYSDMLYSVTLSGKPAYIYILFEHKSYPERFIHLQLLEYIVKIWRLHLKQHPAPATRPITPQLPMILPLVVYHGERPWPYGVRLAEEIIGDQEAFAEYLPDFGVVMLDLSAYSDDDIRGTVLSRVLLLLFKHIFEPDLRPHLTGIFRLLNDLAHQKSGLRYLDIFLRYIYSATQTITPEELYVIAQQVLDRSGGDVLMTIAEQLHQRGLEQGLEQGLNKGELIGEILFAQRILQGETHTRDALKTQSVEELQQILSTLEAQLRKRHVFG